MRITEIIIKPIKPKQPMTLSQARINGLKQNVERDKQRLQQEREQQRKQREADRNLDQQRKAAAL
ncbi:hypothetical protein [Limnohabitans sp. Jir72]|uniref:hypothetical protein n=1 Tax=Limnohabitans sp. Jir72 TaxID=1977909 RepID=UPI000D3403AF|nr:hypothetical protein [Limnohabitans sp. Jir72]PUE25245.1 hypothetical protein B9Z52_16745 [Limnohabitans sp. Jir72]